MINLVLVDDQALVREGVKGLLKLSEKVKVVAEAHDGHQAVDVIIKAAPDVVLMDIRMPKMNGIDAIQSLRESGFAKPIIILTTFDDHQLVLKGLQAGANGYLLKDVSLENLVAAIESVHKGETIVQPAITETLLQSLTAKGLKDSGLEFEALPNPQNLTPKETEILRLIASGYSNREISSALSKSEGTVKNHVSNILSKLGVRDRTRAVLRAIEEGMI